MTRDVSIGIRESCIGIWVGRNETFGFSDDEGMGEDVWCDMAEDDVLLLWDHMSLIHATQPPDHLCILQRPFLYDWTVNICAIYFIGLLPSENSSSSGRLSHIADVVTSSPTPPRAHI